MRLSKWVIGTWSWWAYWSSVRRCCSCKGGVDSRLPVERFMVHLRRKPAHTQPTGQHFQEINSMRPRVPVLRVVLQVVQGLKHHLPGGSRVHTCSFQAVTRLLMSLPRPKKRPNFTWDRMATFGGSF